jgi:hypothetical protein
MTRWGDLVVAELLISYDGAPPLYTVNFIELDSGERIVHERIYIMEGWEAPDWRAPWRSSTSADSVTWD